MRSALPVFLILILPSVLLGCASTRDRVSTDAGFTRVDTGPEADSSVPAAHCANGRRDGDESHVDCGGSCAQCPPGAHCNSAADCTTAVCRMGYCLMAACTDGVQNGDEVGVDCGGGSCPRCPGGTACSAGTDCLSGVCEGGLCAASSCLDGLQNDDETDVDCGGSCPGCAGGLACMLGDDCESLICSGFVCTTAACNDSVRNQDETDVDCGGTLCARCVDGRGCAAATDCMSGDCRDGRCISCTDSVRNGVETDVDCGGTDCPACEDGSTCAVADDCVSLVCTGTVCQMATCTDGVQNQGESDVDCGGPACAACPAGDTCTMASDCASGVCTGGVCQAPTCTDGVRNGTETDVDCGGPGTCPRCADYRICTAASDCATGACTSGRCGTTGCVPFPGTSTDSFGYFACSLPLTPATLPCPNISATGTSTGVSDDSHVYVPIGFTFDFYGTAQTMIGVQSNGTLTFHDSYHTLANSCLPSTATINNFIAVMWDDLDPGNPGGSVKYQTLGTAPNRQFVVQWDTERFSSTPMRADLRVVLYEGSNDIHVCYHNAVFGSASYDNGANATAGIQGGTNSLQYSCNTASLTNGLLLQYLHP